MRTQYLVIGIFLLASGAVIYLRTSAPPPLEYHAAIGYWEDRIGRIGGATAYGEFARFAAPLDASEQHGLAHAFGEALYHSTGIAGITVCDQRFSYGCYHQFVGDAIAAQGLTAVDTLNTGCLKLSAAGPCQHGIGHGLVGYLGYSLNSLKRAVVICDGLGRSSSLQSCYGGAFMEYNMRTLADSSSTRPLTADRFAPCDSYSGTAAQSCYLYQGQWWSQVLPQIRNPVHGFDAMGTLCGGLSGAVRDACFRGVGEMAPSGASYDSKRAFSLCEAATIGDDDRAKCVEGAAIVYIGTDQGGSAREICGMLEDTYRAECFEYANGRKGL